MPRTPKMPPGMTSKGKPVYGSLTKSADLLDERVSEVSNVSKTISTMQKNVTKKVKETKTTLEDKKGDKDLEEVHKNINSVLAKLGDTIQALGTGITNVTVATARATKDAIGQYASAVGRDINYNKQNIVAMSLAQSTPIFGYFAAKFMETDVFRKAKEKISSSISNMFGSLFRRLRFRKKNKDEYDVPHMARGGIVKKAGMAKLHAAEVVMPVDKYLKASQKSQEMFTNKLAKVQAKVIKQAIGYETIGGNYRQVQKMSYQDKMIELVTSIEHALYEQSSPGFFKRLFDNMMKNSLFRGMVDFFRTFKKVVMSPFKAISMAFAPFRWLYRMGKHRWRVDRGYWADLPKGRGVLESMNSIMGMTYAQQMSRLDSIILYTKATAQAVRDLSTHVTGIRYQMVPDISRGGGGFSIFGIMHKMLTKPTEWLAKGALLGIEKAFGVKTGHIREALTKDVLEGFKKWKYNKFTSSKQKFLDSHPLLQSTLHGTGDEGGDFTGKKKLLKYQREYYEVILSKKRGFPKLLGYSSEIVNELQEINRREKRRTAFGILKGLLGGVGNMFSWIGGLFKPGGMLGILGTLAGALFGAGGGGAKGGIIGTMIGNAGRWVSRIFKRGFWGFMGMFAKGGVIAKALTFAMKPVTALGTTILEGLKGFAPKILPFLKSAGWLAAAGWAGWEIGKFINEELGLGKAIQGWLDKRVSDVKQQIESKEDPNHSMNLARDVAKGTGSIDDFRKRQILAYRTNLGPQHDDVGFFGASYISSIENAQRQYIEKNIDKYLPYSSAHVAEMRAKWMKSAYKHGGMLPGQNVEKYAYDREESFLEYLNKYGKKLTDEELSKRSKDFENQYKTTGQKLLEGVEDARKQAGNMVGLATDKVTDLKNTYLPKVTDFTNNAIGAASNFTDNAIQKASEVLENTPEAWDKRREQLMNEVNDALGSAKVIGNRIDEQTKDLQKSTKETGSQFLQGAGHVASTVANSVTQSTQNIVHNGQTKFSNLLNAARENNYIMRPDWLP
jgi:hypothetical protein